MTNDIYLVVGIVVLVLTVPSMVSAFVNSRVPRFAAIMLLIGGGLVVLAVTQQPGGYSFTDVPQVFARVIGQLIN
ncbi:MAG: hypothetical protein GY947_19185 [Rhodobacteraceae bacterium]|nr:hypothetical protein [Paracoccaceae bacterium]